jgi:hypothetical protein
MDLEAFKQSVQPGGKRSVSMLQKFRDGICDLRSNGYTFSQIKDWLAANGVEASPSYIQQYHKRWTEPQAVEAAPAKVAPLSEPRKISNPADLRKARQQVNLSNYE